MTSRDFCFWLQGFFELSTAEKHYAPDGLNNFQCAQMQRHLDLVFLHEVDPSFKDSAELNKIHHGDAGDKVMRC